MIRALADGRVVAAPWCLVNRAPLLVVAALVPGCFYADPINQRPSITIEGEPTEAVHRGDHLEFTARSEDPDGHYVTYQWRGYACREADGADGCDVFPFSDGLLQTFKIDVPIRLADDETPVTLLRVVLEAKDELGATARPSASPTSASSPRPSPQGPSSSGCAARRASSVWPWPSRVS